jgi:predicted Zn-dependent protease
MKRKRLWLIILFAVLLVGGAGTYVGGVLMSMHRTNVWRDEGVAASKAGDHERAATLLGRYLQRKSVDAAALKDPNASKHHQAEQYVEALRCYITSRELAESPNGQHLTDTMAALKILLGLEPDDMAARHHLLELYAKLDRGPETVDLANAILHDTKNGADPRALQLKSEALTRLRQYRDALATVDDWLKLAPLELKPHMARLALRHQLETPGDALIGEANDLAAAHPQDAKFELLQGYAYALAASDERITPDAQADLQARGAERLKAAAAHKDLSDDMVAILVEQFDNLGMSGDAMGTLQQMAKAGASPLVHHTLARRYWQVGQWAPSAAELADVDPHDAKADSTLLALKAIALANLGKKADSDACQDALRGRTHQAVARAWTLLLSQIIDAAQVDSKQVVTECRNGLATEPTNSYLAYYLGDAQARLGDVDLAIQAWAYATQRNLTWAVPPARLVDALIQKGRPEEALGVAFAARRHNPGNAIAELALARAAAVGADAGIAGVDSSQLYLFASALQKQLPGEDTTLAIQVDLLSKQGKKVEAANVIKQAAARSPAPSETLLLRLAAMSRHFGLNVEQDCLAASEKAHGVTPDLAFAQAVDSWTAGKGDEGLARFDALAKRAAKPDDARWRLARARYLDVSSNPAAKPAWVALGDAFPADLAIQQAAASARCVRGDWDFQQRTIDRLHALTGESAIGWRLAKARLMVESPRKDHVDEDVAQGSVELTKILKEHDNIPEPHILLARALIQMNRVEGAIDHLSIAAKLEPFSVPVALQLAGLCQSKGDFDRAKKEIDRVMPQIRTAEQRHAAATLLAKQGNDDDALRILEKPVATASAETKDAPDDLLLAAIYRQRHENDKVDAVLKKLLEKPDPATIEFAATFYASQGRTSDAESALAKLDALNAGPGLAEMVRGRYCTATGDVAGAAGHYQKATAQAPANAAAWRMLAVCDASLGRMDDAIAAVDAGAKAVPSDTALAAAQSHVDVLKQIGADEPLRPLALGILLDPANSGTAADLARAILEERQSFDVQRLASRLQQFVQLHPDFLPGRLQLVQCLAAMNRVSDALSTANRAIAAFPNSAAPAQAEARLALAFQRWNEAAAAAQTWKNRSTDNPYPADLALAQAQIGLGQSDAAINQLQPYLKQAAANPDKYADVLTLQCVALARSGRAQQAQDVLWPLAQKSAAWRARFLQVAGQISDRRESVRWVDRLAEIIPHNAPRERVMIGEAYDQLGTMLADSKLTNIATEMYAELVAGNEVPADILVGAASRAERYGDKPTAETLYRRALALDPNFWVADNNLAMLIVNRGGDAKEAASFAAAAARLSPRQPAVRDTLADVQFKAGDARAAADSENAAVRLDPDNIKWKVRFAQYVLAAGNVAEAERTVQSIDNSGDALSRLPAAEQQALSAQLTDVRKRLHGTKAM